MAKSLFSPSWHRVKDLRPRLRPHVRLSRHHFRGQPWYVIRDEITGLHHRFSPQAYALIGLMDGRRTVDEIWHAAGKQLGDEMPSQDEVISLLSHLHKADALAVDVMPDVAELVERRRKSSPHWLLAAVKSPLAVKIPLFDPEPFLARTRGVARLLFNPVTGLLWLAGLMWLVVQAGMHWPELTRNLADRVLAAENLVLMSLIYPLVKLVHEFGHAYAVKRWGGEVHEMGIMLLIFMPIPYVDASASSGFPASYQRMLVAGAGIMVELAIAMLSMWVWIHAEPGLVRSVAYNALLITGASTLLFNGNPLLRFDAYYVLSDFLQIPNLASRGTQRIAYLARKYLLGMEEDAPLSSDRGERAWLIVYSLAAFVYRVVITFSIAIFVAGKLFIVGVVLALLAAYNMLGKPLVSIVKFFFRNPEARRKRLRAIGVSMLFLLVLWLLLFVMPVPRMTVAHGIVQWPDDVRVLAESDGLMRRLLVPSGTRVARGQPIAELFNSQIVAELEQARGRLAELEVRRSTAVARVRPGEVKALNEETRSTRQEIRRLEQRQEGLTVRAPVAGVFRLVMAQDPVGRYIPRGVVIGDIDNRHDLRIRVAVRQEDVSLVRNDVRDIQVRPADDLGRVGSAALIGEVPSAQKALPSPALSVEGGGEFALDPSHTDEPYAFEAVFLFDVLPDATLQLVPGERAYVRFRHSPQPLAYRWLEWLRRVFLRQLEY